MRYTLVVRRLLLVILLCFTGVAQDVDPYNTLNMLNGRFWLELSSNNRVIYVAALRDAARFESMRGSRLAKEAESKLSERWAFGFSPEDYVKEITELYSATENVRLPVTLAVSYCTKKLGGTYSKQELENFLIQMRRGVAGAE